MLLTSQKTASQEKALKILSLLLVVLVGVYFRYTGLLWGGFEYQHPDERFLIWVVSDISPVENLTEYFDTDNSSLNPANRGHEFYVYGDFPIILARYVTEFVSDQVGWEEILQISRGLSAAFDLVTVLLVYLIANRLFGWRIAFLAGLFSSSAVLQIQQAHFFTVDSFATTFTTLTIYLAVLLALGSNHPSSRKLFQYSILFGVAVGMGMACKLNTVPIAFLLPIGMVFRWFRTEPQERKAAFIEMVSALSAGGVIALIVFRIAQPYAFAGPGFSNIGLDDVWLKSIRDLSAQSAGDVDFPPALQWARRNHLFSFQNLVFWGLGVPLGVTASLGTICCAIEINRRIRKYGFLSLKNHPWPGLIIIWTWTTFYFLWQSTAWNPTMRYQLPIYPTLSILAAWLLGYLSDLRIANFKNWRFQVGLAGAIVLIFTLAWAFAFTRMYNRTETRLQASQWIFDNIAGPVNFQIETQGGFERQLLPISEQVTVRPGFPYITWFELQQEGFLDAVILPGLVVPSILDEQTLRLRAQVIDELHTKAILAEGEVEINSGSYDQLDIPVSGKTQMEPGGLYSLRLEVLSELERADQEILSYMSLQVTKTPQLLLYTHVNKIESNISSFEPTLLMTQNDSTLRKLYLTGADDYSTLIVTISNPLDGEILASEAYPRGHGMYQLKNPLNFKADVSYLSMVNTTEQGEIIKPGTILIYEFLNDPISQFLPGITPIYRLEEPLWQQFTARTSGYLNEISLGYAVQVDSIEESLDLLLIIENSSNPGVTVARTHIQMDLVGNDPRGEMYTAVLDHPVELVKGQNYIFSLVPQGQGGVAIRGNALANESTWDMGLPFRTSGYDPYGGIYRSDLNFEMYWDDNNEKYQRFTNILDQTDYIMISSNRQWGTTTRLPERYPLTLQYYRALLGCPEERDIIWCYTVAEVDTFTGQLGFDLVGVFTSYPNLGPFEINTQFAEEAFTVYDHPKVFIFQKAENYDSSQVRNILDEVDIQQAVRITPKHAADYKDMLLPDSLWKIQQMGGTWAELFPPKSVLNQHLWLAMVAWYLLIFLLGLASYPIIRLALPGLVDHGYPLARIAGLMLLAYFSWLTGSLRVPVTQMVVLIIFICIVIVGILLSVIQRTELQKELRFRSGYFLKIELLALILFSFSLLIRLGNPDLWHPIYGGEKPMNFSQLNAILKSTVFPPYDPWFSGGALNYYYFGYVLVGMPVKLLGITPSISYNLIIPMLFSIVGLATFSIGWNLVNKLEFFEDRSRTWVGLAAVMALLILGNLGTVRMIWEGPQKLIVSDEQILEGNLIERWSWLTKGVSKLINGEANGLPYYPGDWYWKPSRAIQPEAGNEITEFPFFTFLYGDLHAHLMALPLTLLVIAWSISTFLVRGRWRSVDGNDSRLSFIFAMLIGALAVGILRPANTWDQYTYTALAVISLLVSQWKGNVFRDRVWWYSFLPVFGFILLSILISQPFDRWFGQAYNQLIPWAGEKTRIGSYLIHWGLFLCVISTWLVIEVMDWMASTPLSHLNQLRPYRWAIVTGLILVINIFIILLTSGIQVAIIIIPLGLASLLLLFRPGLPDTKKALLFLIGTGLALTLAVEMVAVRGDINRMNTVFKFYFQAWSLLSLSTAASFGWLILRIDWFKGRWLIWSFGLGILILGTALYPVTAINAKVRDRMTSNAPHTLDGMAYMQFTSYGDGPSPDSYQEMDLKEDYDAILWIQTNISGSPVIVEANTPEYRHWGSRFTIYTGLPGVIGWNWHERQQRGLTPDTWVYRRIEAVESFYRSTNFQEVQDFINKYDVGIIILGQLERIYYSGSGLEKFDQYDGYLWEKVYENGATVIYQVK